jgi:hypothetical protein
LVGDAKCLIAAKIDIENGYVETAARDKFNRRV